MQLSTASSTLDKNNGIAFDTELEELDFNYSPFVRKESDYKREINPLSQYVKQASQFLAQNNPGYTEEHCREFIMRNFKQDGLFPFNDPVAVYLEKDENGDRQIYRGKFSNYIKDSVKNRHLIAPTFTTYTHPQDKQSYLVEYIDGKVAARKAHKKEQFKAKMVGDMVKFAMENNNQNNAKVSLNSISGASCTASTPIYRKTIHSTLTSNCRVTSGFANANNEKLLAGNRHYRAPDVTLNNIVSIVNNTNYVQFEQMMTHYDLKYPSVEVVYAFILRCSRQYWSNKLAEAEIYSYLTKLKPIELAAFLYTGDLWSLSRLNGHFVKGMIADFARPVFPTDELTVELAIKYTANFSEEIINLAVQIHQSIYTGIQALKRDEKTNEYLYKEEMRTLIATCINIQRMQVKYELLFDTLCRSNNMPASLAYFPDSIRHVVLMSDTDSTIFTVQDWIRWCKVADVVEDQEDISALLDETYEDKFDLKDFFTDEGNAVFAVMVFFAVCTLKHILATMSANHGIEEKRMFQVAMKNEFKFDPFVPTFKTKHYYAQIPYQEGNILSEKDMEIKGVHLKSSNAPVKIVKNAANLMKSICDTVSLGQKINLEKILVDISEIEKEIIKSVDDGKYEYYRTGQIKGKESYSLDETQSNYRHYTFWNEVFGPKYGMAPPPPYSFIKMPTTIDNKQRTNEWIAQIEDEELKGRLLNYMAKSEREHFGSFLIPRELFAVSRLPEEITRIVDKRSMVSDIGVLYYFILETCGVFLTNKKQTKLISDLY